MEHREGMQQIKPLKSQSRIYVDQLWVYIQVIYGKVQFSDEKLSHAHFQTRIKGTVHPKRNLWVVVIFNHVVFGGFSQFSQFYRKKKALIT